MCSCRRHSAAGHHCQCHRWSFRGSALHLVCSLGLRAANRSVAFWPSSSYTNTPAVPTRCSLQSTALAVLPESVITELCSYCKRLARRNAIDAPTLIVIRKPEAFPSPNGGHVTNIVSAVHSCCCSSPRPVLPERKSQWPHETHVDLLTTRIPQRCNYRPRYN